MTHKYARLSLQFFFILLFFVTFHLACAGSLSAQPLRIIYNNDNVGELVSCGCQNKLGSLAKKASYINMLHKSSGGVPTLFIDAGNQLFKAHYTQTNAMQAACIRAKGILAANRQMGLAFGGLGENDLAAGPEFLREIAGNEFTWLSLNLVDPKGEPLFQGLSLARVGGLTVAVLGLCGSKAASKGFRVRPWQEVLPAWVEKARAKADIVILLSNNPLSENRLIARTCPGIDLIFQAGYALGNLPPVAIGNTLISQTDVRGRYLGLLEIDWHAHGPWSNRSSRSAAAPMASSYKQRFIPLNAEIPDDQNMLELTSAFERQAKALSPRP